MIISTETLFARPGLKWLGKKDKTVSPEVFERGNPFSNLYLCFLVGQADAVCIFVRGSGLFKSAWIGILARLFMLVLFLKFFIFASLRNMKFVRRGSRADHIGNGVVGWDEGKDVLGVRDDDVQHVGLVGGEHTFHCWF